MKLGMDESFCGIGQLFDKVANAMGMTREEGQLYDPSCIYVARNICENVQAYYKSQNKNFDTFDFAMLWMNIGAKVDETLSDDEVVVVDGFITTPKEF